MTDKPTGTIDLTAERDKRLKAVCDGVINRAASLMVDELGAPIPMMLDRMLTYAAAQACSIDGSPNTAAVFRTLAAKIESGVFHSVTGENQTDGRQH